MSKISEALNAIMDPANIYGKDIRKAIHDGIEVCYDDVTSPALNSEAFKAAVQSKIDDGSIAAMTIGEKSLTGDKLADETITKDKLGEDVQAEFSSLKEELENLKKIVEALQESMGQIYGNIVVSETTISMDEGTSVTFTVSLDKAPSENQTVEITTKGSYVTISPSTLTFTPDNYNVAQRVTVSSIDDEDEGDKQETITLASVYKTVQISITIVNNDVSIEWHTVTMDDIKVATVVGVNCITAITTTEPYLNFPADLPCLRLSTACETVKGIKLNDGGKAEWDSAEYNLLDRYPNLETVTGGGINLHDRTGAKRTTMPFNFGGVAENIKEFTFYPIGLTSISQTFKGMTKLEKIFDIPETVTSWAFAFNNCVSLHKVTVKSDTLSLNDSLPAFTGVPA